MMVIRVYHPDDISMNRKDTIYIGSSGLFSPAMANPYEIPNPSISERDMMVTRYAEDLLQKDPSELKSFVQSLDNCNLVHEQSPQLTHGHIFMLLVNEDVWQKPSIDTDRITKQYTQRWPSVFDMAGMITCAANLVRQAVLLHQEYLNLIQGATDGYYKGRANFEVLEKGTIAYRIAKDEFHQIEAHYIHVRAMAQNANSLSRQAVELARVKLWSYQQGRHLQIERVS